MNHLRGNAHQPFLQLRSATFRLGERLVFERTTWTLLRNEQWAIVGPNGAGKSLFADALRGQLPLVGGELRFHFRPPAGLNHEEAIGHVAFEDRRHELHHTVVQSRWNSLEEESTLRVSDFLSYERVMEINPFEVEPLGYGVRRRAAFERRRRQAVEVLRVTPFLAHSLLSLSNGEMQRVQLARALSRPSRLLILDEPFAGLDTQTRRHFRAVLEHLMATALRVLLLTTRPEDLPRQVNHLLRIEDCRVVYSGPRRRGPDESAAPPPGPRRGGATGATQRAGSTTASPSRVSQNPAPRAANNELVRLRNVTLRYGETTLLENINWTIRAGESWALLGPNGSGKTTLLSLLTGDNPQAYVNDVVLFGKRRGEGEPVWRTKQRIGWVSPELHLHFDDAAPCLDVVASGFRDTVGLFEPPTRPQRRAALALLAQFRLSQYVTTPLFALSVGLQRMVLLSRALVKKPALLILDEPCQSLDAPHRMLFIEAVDRLLRAGGVTAIYVTHRRDEIPPSINRVFRLDHGRGRRASLNRRAAA